MTKCWFCNEEIEFRSIDGERKPIHINGQSCTGGNHSTSKNSNSLNKSFSRFNNKDTTLNDFCTPTTCPKCNQEVFFIRHNGGSVWVDSLGWPWPKHPCMDSAKEPNWYSFFKKNTKTKAKNELFTGVIEKSQLQIRDDSKLSSMIIKVNGGDQGSHVIAIKCISTEEYIINKIAILNFIKNTILISTHDIMPIVDTEINNNFFG